MNDQTPKDFDGVNERIAVALEGLQQGVKQINDTNVLHMSLLQANVETLKQNTAVVTNIQTYWGTIVKWLILALIVLAGAEKLLKFLGIGV